VDAFLDCDAHFISNPSQISSLITLALASCKYNLALFTMSTVALNEYRRFLVFYSSKIECINIAMKHILYASKLRLPDVLESQGLSLIC